MIQNAALIMIMLVIMPACTDQDLRDADAKVELTEDVLEAIDGIVDQVAPGSALDNLLDITILAAKGLDATLDGIVVPVNNSNKIPKLKAVKKHAL